VLIDYEGTLAANEYHVLTMTGVQTQGTTKIRKSDLRFIKSDNAATGVTDFEAEYTALFGVPALGDRIGYKVLAINQNTGQSRPVGEGLTEVFAV
jgi:hypothetical protein